MNNANSAGLHWPSLLLSIATAGACYWWGPDDQAIRAALSLTTFIGMLWLTEAIDITFSALLVPVLAIAFGLLSARQAFADFSNPVIFLFLGGFALAAALSRHGIDRDIGAYVLKLSGRYPIAAAYMLFAATAFLSMWISNTATAAMMLPVALGVASRFNDPEGRTVRFLLLGTAYAASIGGMATLVGSPPNAIAAASQQISFVQWLAFGMPMALTTLPLMVALLQLLLRPSFVPITTPVSSGTRDVTAVDTRGRAFTLAIFVAVVVGWMFSASLAKSLGISKDFDTWVALTGLLALGITGAVRWQDIEKNTSWGILLLFGAGMTLSTLLETTGTSVFIANHLQHLVTGIPSVVAILIMVAFIVFLSELVSNTAAAALLIPLLIPVAAHFGLTPLVMAVTVSMAASSSFMLPVATPPNAIIFGSGQVPQRSMMQAGFFLNLICISLITLLATVVWA